MQCAGNRRPGHAIRMAFRLFRTHCMLEVQRVVANALHKRAQLHRRQTETTTPHGNVVAIADIDVAASRLADADFFRR